MTQDAQSAEYVAPQCCYCGATITLFDGRGWVHDGTDTDRCYPHDPMDLTEAEPLINAATWAGLTPPYRTIVADPPWHTHNNGAGGQKGHTDVRAESKYSTMTTEEICGLPVAALAARDAHLYLWVTASGLDRGLAVMAAWGFTYKTTLTWVKLGALGLGAYFRTMTEHVLFGIRGSLATTATDQRNVFEAAKQGHSVKPEAFLDLVERSSPPPYVELFCRRPRMGWDSWGKGYEVPRPEVILHLPEPESGADEVQLIDGSQRGTG